jgi:pimeloyl-ACP methyl ester carboxylesterase
MPRLSSLLLGLVVVVVGLWVLTPMARAMLLLRETQHTVEAAPVIDGVQATGQHFYSNNDSTGPDASSVPENSIPIAGWLYVVNTHAPTVILLPGWKDDRSSMVGYASMLLKGGLNVMAIDFRGTGHSGGEFSLGLNEPMDVKAAITQLDSLGQLSNHHYALFGVSFGAGVAIATAGGNGDQYLDAPEVVAVVADSPWATEDNTVDRLNAIPLPGFSIPLPHSVTLFGHHIQFLPDAQWAVNSTIGGNLDTRSALEGAKHLTSNQSLLIIHSAGDTNPTTSEAAARQLYDAAHVKHKSLWIAPAGGHASAMVAQPEAYQSTVLTFLQKYLVGYHDAPAPSVAPSYSGGSPTA